MSLLDPDLPPEETRGNSWWGGRRGIFDSYHTILNQPSYDDLVRACSKKIPSDRTIQLILGASWAPSITDTWVIPDYHLDLHEVSISDDEEVFGWLLYTVGVAPLRVLAVLHGMSEQSKVGS